MTQAQNDAPSTSFSRDVVLKILGESGVHDADSYLTEEMVREFGFGGFANLEALKQSLKKARGLSQVRKLTCEVDFEAANRCRVPTHILHNLSVGSFKAMDWNICAWDLEKTRVKLPDCTKLEYKNRSMEFVPIKQKSVSHGFSVSGGLEALHLHGLRPALAQEFACYCIALGVVPEGIELVALGSVLVRSHGDGLYCFNYLAFDNDGFRATVEKEKNNNSTDRFFIGVSRD